jgi:hypothetical protein
MERCEPREELFGSLSDVKRFAQDLEECCKNHKFYFGNVSQLRLKFVSIIFRVFTSSWVIFYIIAINTYWGAYSLLFILILNSLRLLNSHSTYQGI